MRYNYSVKSKKPKRNAKKIVLLSLLSILVFVTLISFRVKSPTSIPHRDLVDTKISQYSDSHITQNAVVTNPEFKNIAFDNISAKSSFLTSPSTAQDS